MDWMIARFKAPKDHPPAKSGCSIGKKIHLFRAAIKGAKNPFTEWRLQSRATKDSDK
jgi:hypothetical protein